MAVNIKDLGAGAIFVAFGAFFVLNAAFSLRMGTAFRMGPGYFPIMVGALLIVFGAAIFLRGFVRTPSPLGRVSWRGILLLTLAPVVFAVTVSGLGLVPTVAITVLISAFASRRMGILAAVGLSIGLTVFCVLVFGVGIGLPLRYFGPWLGG